MYLQVPAFMIGMVLIMNTFVVGDYAFSFSYLCAMWIGSFSSF